MAGYKTKILLVVIISVAGLELGLRLIQRVNPSFVFYTQSYNRFRGKPGSRDFDFRLNSKGFKDLEYEVCKQENSYRILGIGDSFVFGIVPYPHHFLTILEGDLNTETCNNSVEIINMGIPGTSPYNYYQLFMDEGLELQPDMVIVFIFIGNDFTDIFPEDRVSILSYSYTLAYLKFLKDLKDHFDGIVINRWPKYNNRKGPFSPKKFFDIECSRSWIFDPNQSSRFKDNFRFSIRYIEKIHSVCRQRDIRFLAVLIPDEVQVNEHLREEVAALLGIGVMDLDVTLPNDMIDNYFIETGIQFIDLLDIFSEESSAQTLYRPWDTHWNFEGNRIAADYLLPIIRDVLRYDSLEDHGEISTDHTDY